MQTKISCSAKRYEYEMMVKYARILKKEACMAHEI